MHTPPPPTADRRGSGCKGRKEVILKYKQPASGKGGGGKVKNKKTPADGSRVRKRRGGDCGNTGSASGRNLI